MAVLLRNTVDGQNSVHVSLKTQHSITFLILPKKGCLLGHSQGRPTTPDTSETEGERGPNGDKKAGNSKQEGG